MLVAGTLAFLGVSTTQAQTQNPMRPGRWETTVQMEMPGMPMKMPAQKVTQCVTKEQLEKPGGGLPSGAKPGEKNPCTVSDHKVEGNRITWKMTCTGDQPMTGTGDIVVDGDTYTGTMKMTSDQGQMTMHYTAKRLGDCEQ
jgi:hypothetical protein